MNFQHQDLTKNNSGFSLLELLVAVAVIGILAAIGIGNYAKTQARVRQSEAKASLATIFVAETSFYGEYNMYTVDLKNLGFGVYGTRLRYMTGFFPGAGCTNYDTSKGAPAELTTLANTWSCGANVNVVSTDQAVAWKLPTSVTMVNDQCTVSPTAPTGTASACDDTYGAQSFSAVSIGDPSRDPGLNPNDGWTMNQNKFLSNTTSGLE